jgi:hypothetical protein
MNTPYVAYGMQLEASFELPGLVSRRAEDLPALSIDLIEPDALDQMWTAGACREEWVGRLGDGHELRIERATGGERLFTYADRARFHLDAGADCLTCAAARGGLDWVRALLTKVISAVSVMRGYEALHAAALDTPAGAVAIAAPSGMGKTTLALELVGRGWTLLSDDVLVLSRERSGVAAHAGTAHMNLDPRSSRDALARAGGERIAILDGEHWVSVNAVATSPRPVRAVFMLERADALRLAAARLPPSPIPLVPYVLGLESDEVRRRARFALYGEMVSSAALLRLTCGSQDDPTAIADLIQATVAEQTSSARASELA